MTVNTRLKILAANERLRKTLAEQAKGEIYKLHQRLALARADSRYEAHLMLKIAFDNALQKSKEFKESPEMSADLTRYFYDRARIYIIPAGPQKGAIGIRLIERLPSYFRMKAAMQAEREAEHKVRGAAILSKSKKLTFWTYLYNTRFVDRKQRYHIAIRKRTENLGHKVPYWKFMEKGSKGYPPTQATNFIQGLWKQRLDRKGGAEFWNLYLSKVKGIEDQTRDFAQQVIQLGKIPRGVLSTGYVPAGGQAAQLRFSRKYTEEG